MPIIDLQMKARELGRIRMGQVVATKGGKTRPDKLDKFRLTSASRPLLESVAALYGGSVEEWEPQGGGAKQWEVFTTSTRLPIMVPPQPVSQFYELWSGGGCTRRCDGVTELRSDTPCMCGPDPADRECKPTTRLNVVLRDVPGIGVWRLETHGYYAAVELPQAAHFLAQAGGYVDGYLALEARRIKREGEPTRDFMVPVLEIDVTPAQLLAGQGAPTALAPLAAPVAAIAAPVAAKTPARSRDDYLKDAAWCADLDALTALFRAAQQAGHTDDEVLARFHSRRVELESGMPSAEDLWSSIVSATPEGWTLTALEEDFLRFHGNAASDATQGQLASYLTHLRVDTQVGAA